MRFVFVRPMASFNRYIQNVPLNYIHLAAWLRQAGHEPSIFDLVLPQARTEDLDAFIEAHRVPIVGIGCMTCEFPAAIAEARRLKQRHPQLKIVLGGAHASADPEECLNSGVVDYVIVGEGELPLTTLLARLEAGEPTTGIQGLWCRDAEGLILPTQPAPTPDVNLLPRPAYDLLPLEAYFQLDSPWHFPKSKRAVQFISSRGCPYRCSYCHTIHGKRYRGQDPAMVLDQIEWLVKEHGVQEFMMVDDIFNFDLERAKAICRGIIERGLKLHLQFPNGVRGDRFDEELVQLMKRAGTHFMAIAIETVSERFQKLIRKNLKIDKAMETIHQASAARIEVSGFFMIGFPGETEEEVRATLDFAANAPLDAIFISIVTPFKGTVMRNDIQDGRFGAMDSDVIDALDELFPVIRNASLSRADLERLQKQTYWRFYLRPRALKSLTRRMTNLRNLKKLSRAVTRRLLPARATVSVN